MCGRRVRARARVSPAIVTVAEYTAAGLNGDVTPAHVAILVGPNSPNGAITTGGFPISQSQPLAVDGAGQLYYVDCNDNRVIVFAANGTMLRTFGNAQQVSCPSYVAVSAGGTAYVAAQLLPATGSVAVYPPGATPATTPATISTGGEAPTGLAVDPAGNLSVLVRDPNSLVYGVEVFAAGAGAPSRVFVPADWVAGNQFFNTIGVDASGKTYVPEQDGSFTYVFSSTANGGNALPNHTLSFIMPSTRGTTFTPATFVDAGGAVYVGDSDTSSILIYPKNSTVPSRTIFGDQTELNGIFNLVVDGAGDIFASTIYGTSSSRPGRTATFRRAACSTYRTGCGSAPGRRRRAARASHASRDRTTVTPDRARSPRGGGGTTRRLRSRSARRPPV